MTHPLLLRAPVVDAVRILDRGEDIATLEIICPYCDQLHYHGGGDTPGAGDGHRITHCRHPDSRPGYILREVGSREGRSPLRGLAPPGLRLVARRAVSFAQRTRILERDDFRCRRCGTGPREERLVVDHIVPVARGGSSDDDNLQTLCEPCNQGKGARPPHPHDLEGRA